MVLNAVAETEAAGIVCFREGFIKISSDQREKLSYQDIIDLAHLNDIGTLNALQNFGFYLGIGLTNILNTFNPQAVILRNSIIESHPMVLNSMRSEVSSRVYSHLDNSYELLPSFLGKMHPL